MPRFAASVRTAVADAVVDQIDVGGGTAVLQLRTGNAPSNITDAAAGTLLASFNLPNPAFGAASAGVATAGAISPTTGAAAGTVGHYRVVNRGGTAVWDANYSTGGLTLNTTTVSVGVDVEVTGWTVTAPAGAV